MKIFPCNNLITPNTFETDKRNKKIFSTVALNTNANFVDVLASQNKSILNISFKGVSSETEKLSPKAEIKELTDDEFKELKKKLKAKIKTMPKEVQKEANLWEFNKYNIQLADKILSNEKIYDNVSIMFDASDIVCVTDTLEEAQISNSIFSNNKLYGNPYLIVKIRNFIANAKTDEQIRLTKKILSHEFFLKFPDNILYMMDMVSWADTPDKVQITDKILNYEDLYSNNKFISGVCSIKTPEKLERVYNAVTPENIEKVGNQYSIVMQNPELYLNGEWNNSNWWADNLFNNNYLNLLLFSDVFDKETMNTLLRMRFDDSEDYLEKFYDIGLENAKLVKGLAECTDKNTNKPFTPAEKIGFIDLVDAYDICGKDKTTIKYMIDAGRADVQELNRGLLFSIFEKAGFVNNAFLKIADEKLNLWNMKYIHLLAQELDSSEEEEVFYDLIKACTLYDFNEYINDSANDYGWANDRTKQAFIEHKIDYDKWLKPSKENNVQFIAKDKNTEKLSQISAQIIEDIEILRKTPAKGFVDKQIKDYIQNGKLVIPNEITNNKEKLLSFTQNLLHLFEAMFKRAESNLNSPDKEQNAQSTLTIKNHLEQRLKDISKVKDEQNKTNNLDLTIKMWDRMPQKDIFQGNYSTCCIGMNEVNGLAMPHYLLNTAFNMIEIIDNTTNKTIGNALCYFVEQANGKPAFVIDNIEINNAHKPSDKVGRKLRSAIVEYASNVVKEVTGNNKMPIFMGNAYNDVPDDDLKEVKGCVNLLGETDCDAIYMDFFGGWDYFEEVTMLKLK